MIRPNQRNSTEKTSTELLIFHISDSKHRWCSYRAHVRAESLLCGHYSGSTLFYFHDYQSRTSYRAASICSHQPTEQLREGQRDSRTAQRPCSFSFLTMKVQCHIWAPSPAPTPTANTAPVPDPYVLILQIRAHTQPVCPYGTESGWEGSIGATCCVTELKLKVSHLSSDKSKVVSSLQWALLSRQQHRNHSTTGHQFTINSLEKLIWWIKESQGPLL